MGALFGLILQYARLNKFEVISGMARLEDYTVAKALALAIGLGIIILSITIGLGWASYHVKPLYLWRATATIRSARHSQQFIPN